MNAITDAVLDRPVETLSNKKDGSDKDIKTLEADGYAYPRVGSSDAGTGQRKGTSAVAKAVTDILKKIAQVFNRLSDKAQPKALSVLNNIKDIPESRLDDFENVVQEFVERAKHEPIRPTYQPLYPNIRISDTKITAEQVLEAFFNAPEKRHPELLARLVKAQHEPEIPFPKSKEEMKDFGIKTYTEYKAETKAKTGKESKDSKECLRQNFGPWLPFATPRLDRHYMSQAHLKKFDKPLFGRLRQEYSTEELNIIIPSIDRLNDEIAKEMSEEDIKNMNRLSTMAARRIEPE